MLNRLSCAVLAVMLVFVIGSSGLLAQERVKLGRFTDFAGNAQVKEIGATGTYVQLQDTWLNQAVYKGDELLTLEDSYIEIMIESTKVELFDGTHITMDKTSEGLYVVNMTRGKLTSHIKTDVFHIRVLNQTVYGKDTVVSVKVEPDRDIVIKAISGAPYVENEYGATLAIPEEQVVIISYDRLRRHYIFRAHPDNVNNFGVLPKGATKHIAVPNGKEFVAYEDGRGELRDPSKGPGWQPPGDKKPGTKRKFSISALIRYDWYEYRDDVFFYDGGRETFTTAQAELRIDSRYKFLHFKIGVDAVEDNTLTDLWLRLFIPKHEDIINLKIGQMQVPFGIQPQLGAEELLLANYSQAVKYAFCSTQGDPDPAVWDLDYLYDVGVQAYGELEFIRKVKLQYSAGLFNGEKRVTADSNSRKAGVGRLGLNFGDSFIVGASAYDGDIGTRPAIFSRRRNGIDMKIDTGQFILQGEYIWAEDNPEVGKKYNITEGYYLEMGLGLGLLMESLEKWMFVAKVDILDPPRGVGIVNPNAEHLHQKSTLVAAGLAWEISEHVKVIAVFETINQGKDRYEESYILDPRLNPLGKNEADQRAVFQLNINF